VRVGVLLIALVFIGALAVLTVLDFVHYGVTLIGILAILILVLFMTGIVGALREPPKK
jgi:ABC-type branched-subunit amino acid transport system permease subunit